MKKIVLLLVTGLVTLLTFAQDADRQLAMALVQKNQQTIGLSADDMANLVISDTYLNKTSGTRLVYLQQTFAGIPVYNQLQVLSFKNDRLLYKSGGRINSLSKKVQSSPQPAVYAEQAIHAALADRKLFPTQPALVIRSEQNGHFITFNDMGVSREPITARLNWVPMEDGTVNLAWMVYVIPVNSADYWLIRVDAKNKSILGMDNFTVYCNWDRPHTGCSLQHNTSAETPSNRSLNNLQQNTANSPLIVNGASYRVIPFPFESPNHTNLATTLVTNPWEAAPGNATSLKWHSDGTTDYNYTRGNNVWAREDRDGSNASVGLSANSTTNPDPLTFDFTPDFNVTPIQTTPVPNQQFNITNLFYWNNIIHDITYQYGFDELAGNFQASNQGRGGNENDYVIADAQDGGGTNNANFSTPADGGSGRMQMYLWSGTPQKDGDVDNGIVTHEFGHGISNRLTGGPSQASCLQNAEQMGEGWSDYYGLMYTQDWANSNLNTGFNVPRGIGTYAIGQGTNGLGIRSQRYSTNFAVNNKVYANSISAQQHNRGEIWCATLWDMTWNIINQVGTINPNIYNATGGGGNTIALKLVTEGMKLQPCSPGFIDGRDAILAADSILYNGAYSCAIREAFRRRGMGAFVVQGSSSSVTDQIADYTAGNVKLKLTQNGTVAVPEGQTITYTNRVENGPCTALTNFLLTDTLPANVTHVSGGTYNATNRVVSFPVNLNPGETGVYTFVVRINTGAWFPTVTLFEDQANTNVIPASIWNITSTTANNWSSSTDQFFSSPRSYFSPNPTVASDQRLILTNPIALGANPPKLSFRHWYNTEGSYDGGVLEVSTNGGTVWTDVRPNILIGRYTGTMDASTLLAGRQAWTGSTNGQFIRTVVNLQPYANQSAQFRFRYTTDVGTALTGWYVDDIYIRSEPVVDMFSNLYNASGVRVFVSDTITQILPPNTCNSATVTTPPAAVNACEGSNATFTVAASGTNNTYQWQMSTDGGANWTDISGATNTSLTVNAVTLAMNNNRYRVNISNSCPSNATSDAAILTVSAPASITAQPTAVTACSGNAVSFTIGATGGGVTYQWEVSTNGGANWSAITGANAATLNLGSVATGDNNNLYRVLVQGCAPNALVSNQALLTVNAAASISTQPQAVIACSGANASFTVTGAGTGLSYQWQVSTNGGTTFTDIPGANTNTYSITGLSSSQNQNLYQVIINSAACPAAVTSSQALLTVNDAASITQQPANAQTCPGNQVSFTVSAIGSGLGYQWQESTDGGNTWTNISGANASSYTINAVLASQNNHRYRAVISNSCSATSLTSDAATLTVSEQAAISLQPANASACVNGNAGFSVAATGSGLIYQWQISTDGGATYTDITGANQSTYDISNLSAAQNNHRYRCVISAATCGPVNSSAATLVVNPIPTVSLSANPHTQLYPGLTTTLTASSSPVAASYAWYRNGNLLTGVTGNSLLVDYANIGSYTVTIADINGCSNSSDVVAITDSVQRNSTFLFPNPNQGQFQVRDISSGLISSDRIVTIYDSKGARVYQQRFVVSVPNSLLDIYVEKLASGTYVLLMTDNQGNIIGKGKFVKD